jgi:hypothetical protein
VHVYFEIFEMDLLQGGSILLMILSLNSLLYVAMGYLL